MMWMAVATLVLALAGLAVCVAAVAGELRHARPRTSDFASSAALRALRARKTRPTKAPPSNEKARRKFPPAGDFLLTGKKLEPPTLAREPEIDQLVIRHGTPWGEGR